MKKALFITGFIFLAAFLLGGRAWFSNTFPSTGDVGIGTTSPSYPLDVQAGPSRFYSDSSLIVQQKSTAADDQGIKFIGWDYNVRAFFYMNVNTGEARIGSGPGGYFTSFYANNSEAARIDANQRVLVGYTSNQDGNKEQVNGTVSATGFKMSTGACNGCIATSDASGNESWQTAPTSILTATYTPTFSGLTGCTSITLNHAYYSLDGKHYRVNIGGWAVGCTAGSTIGINASLPSGATAYYQNAGSIDGSIGITTNGFAAAIGDITSNGAFFQALPLNSGTLKFNMQFDYFLQ